MTSTRGQFADTLMSTLSLAVNGLSRIISSVIVGRGGGPSLLGLFQSGLATAQLASLVFPTALGSAASTFMARAEGAQDPAIAAATRSHLARRNAQATVVVTVVSSALWAWIVDSSVLAVGSFALLTSGVCTYVFTRACLYGRGQVARATRWDVATSLLGLGAVSLGMALDVRNSLLLACVGLNYILFAFANWPKGAKVPIPRQLAREIDAFTGYAVLGTLASSGFLHFAILAAGATGGADDAGNFGAAFVLATPALLFSSAISVVLYPRLSQAVGRGEAEKFRSITDVNAKVMAILMVPLFGSVILLRGDLVHFIWGSSFGTASTLLLPMLVGLLLTTLAIPAVNSITSASPRGIRLSAMSSLIGMVTGCASWFFFVPWFGLQGIAFGVLIGLALASIVPFAAAWRWHRMKWSGLALRTGLGLAYILAAVGLQQATGINLELDLLLTAVLLLAWAALNFPVVRELRLGKTHQAGFSGVQ